MTMGAEATISCCLDAKKLRNFSRISLDSIKIECLLLEMNMLIAVKPSMAGH
jgi:hypothetical protein